MSKLTTKTLATLAVGDLFTVISFTGLQFGTYKVTKVGKTKFQALNKKGEELVFNKADGMQIVEEGKEKWASRAVDLFPKAERKPLIEPETDEQRRARRKARRDARKAAEGKTAVEDDGGDEDEEEETPAPKKADKKSKKAAPAPAVEEDDEEEDVPPAPPAKKDKKADKKATKEDDGWDD